MKRIVLNVDPTLAEALQKKRIETGIPMTEFIRRAVRLALFADAAQKIEKRSSEPIFEETR